MNLQGKDCLLQCCIRYFLPSWKYVLPHSNINHFFFFSTNFRRWNFFLLSSFRSKPENFEAEKTVSDHYLRHGFSQMQSAGMDGPPVWPAMAGRNGATTSISAAFTAWKAGLPSKGTGLQSVETRLKSMLHSRGTAVPPDTLWICLEGRLSVYTQEMRKFLHTAAGFAAVP